MDSGCATRFSEFGRDPCKTREADPMLVWRWYSVYDAGPTPHQHWFSIPSLLGWHSGSSAANQTQGAHPMLVCCWSAFRFRVTAHRSNAGLMLGHRPEMLVNHWNNVAVWYDCGVECVLSLKGIIF